MPAAAKELHVRLWPKIALTPNAELPGAKAKHIVLWPAQCLDMWCQLTLVWPSKVYWQICFLWHHRRTTELASLHGKPWEFLACVCCPSHMLGHTWKVALLSSLNKQNHVCTYMYVQVCSQLILQSSVFAFKACSWMHVGDVTLWLRAASVKVIPVAVSVWEVIVVWFQVEHTLIIIKGMIHDAHTFLWSHTDMSGLFTLADRDTTGRVDKKDLSFSNPVWAALLLGTVSAHFLFSRARRHFRPVQWHQQRNQETWNRRAEV